VSALALPRIAVPAGLRQRLSGRYTVLALVVVVATVTHGINMLGYPYLEADEGTYFSQAWSVLHDWSLSPYTYFYDHAPLGWIQMALWQLVTADARLDTALDSGRVFMLVLQVLSTVLVYLIGRRLAGRHWIALLAVAAFVLSTYGIHYHRRVLLDNVVTFWILLSLWLLVRHGGLRQIWLSAIAMGVAVLSKEIALAFVLPFAVLVLRQAPRESRGFAIVGWSAITASVISVYPLMALLKGEFFPAGSPLGGSGPHVSLVCSLNWQSSRSSDGGLLDGSSQFWTATSGWAHQEPLLVLGGTACALLAVTAFRRHIVLSMLGWMIIAFWLFIGRGGVVLDFYLVPLLPLLALTLALVVEQAVVDLRRVSRPVSMVAAAAAFVACLGLAVLAYSRSSEDLWTARPVEGQQQAVSWIHANLPPDSRMVIDMSMWMDLHVPASGRQPFQNAHYYWRVGQDPALRRSAFRDSWRSADYVIATPQLISDTKLNRFPIVAEALENSTIIKRFDSGWPIEIRRVNAAAPNVPLPRAAQEESMGCMGTEV
jgi:4-amino-4-deoxy-L-arabinose transferase-like glycosyltransferase